MRALWNGCDRMVVGALWNGCDSVVRALWVEWLWGALWDGCESVVGGMVVGSVVGWL